MNTQWKGNNENLQESVKYFYFAFMLSKLNKLTNKGPLKDVTKNCKKR